MGGENRRYAREQAPGADDLSKELPEGVELIGGAEIFAMDSVMGIQSSCRGAEIRGISLGSWGGGAYSSPAPCGMLIPYARVRGLRDDVRGLKAAFGKEGYMQEKGAFIVSLWNCRKEKILTSDDIKNKWNAIWKDINDEFEQELSNYRSYKSLGDSTSQEELAENELHECLVVTQSRDEIINTTHICATDHEVYLKGANNKEFHIRKEKINKTLSKEEKKKEEEKNYHDLVQKYCDRMGKMLNIIDPSLGMDWLAKVLGLEWGADGWATLEKITIIATHDTPIQSKILKDCTLAFYFDEIKHEARSHLYLKEVKLEGRIKNGGASCLGKEPSVDSIEDDFVMLDIEPHLGHFSLGRATLLSSCQRLLCFLLHFHVTHDALPLREITLKLPQTLGQDARIWKGFVPPTFAKQSSPAFQVLRMQPTDFFMHHHMPILHWVMSPDGDAWQGPLYRSIAFVSCFVEYLCKEGGVCLELGCGTAPLLSCCLASRRACASIDLDDRLIISYVQSLIRSRKRPREEASTSWDVDEEVDLGTELNP
ncbi:hypothetical protein L7F22_059926 [Adiantum nelumboides]|nr:hypothetical protein [Adiantum nelumboides]